MNTRTTPAQPQTRTELLCLIEALAVTGDFSQPFPGGGVQVFPRLGRAAIYYGLRDHHVAAAHSGPSLIMQPTKPA